MATFQGTSVHSLDEKGRLIVPKRILDQVAKADQEFTVTGGLDGCLWVLDRQAWRQIQERFATSVLGSRAERALRRRLLGFAETVTPDRSGRIPLNSSLRRYAGIEDGDGVVLVGAGQILEIWSQSRLDEAMPAAASDDEEQLFADSLVGSTSDTTEV